jgi:monovalent cation:H+ antiporter-2, CPA2 family
VIGLCTVPYAIRAVARLGRPETLLITSVGLCFAFAMAAEHARYSVALGAFLAGSLVAESGQGTMVEHLVAPLRDIFGAVFFVSVGMMIDPGLLAQYWPAVLALSGVVVAGKIAAVTGASLLIGEPFAIALRTGFALAQIGEFSFIIADVGRTGGVTRPFLYSIAVAVSTITAFLTPFLIGASAPAAVWLRHHLPGPVASMLTHYEGWVTGLRRQPSLKSRKNKPHILVRSLSVTLSADTKWRRPTCFTQGEPVPRIVLVCSPVAQSVERTAVNRQVAGSNPARGAK